MDVAQTCDGFGGSGHELWLRSALMSAIKGDLSSAAVVARAGGRVDVVATTHSRQRSSMSLGSSVFEVLLLLVVLLYTLGGLCGADGLMRQGLFFGSMFRGNMFVLSLIGLGLHRQLNHFFGRHSLTACRASYDMRGAPQTHYQTLHAENA